MQDQQTISEVRSESTVELDNMRQQFDNAPFPALPLDQSPRDDLDALYVHNLVTPCYLRTQQIVETQGKVLLDAGCGTGYTSLLLAEANPGARIMGIDLSAKSVDLAAKRLQYHGFEDVEFHALSIEDLPQLRLEFDFINCDETLYLLPDPLAGLQAMQAVLKPEGVIRVNLHSSLQRDFCYRAQRMFTLMGLMEDAIEDFQVEFARSFMMSVKNSTALKSKVWTSEMETNDGLLRSNLLLQGDKGFTIPETFDLLKTANLEFISMVRWRQWELLDLFHNPSDLPPLLAMGLPELTIEQQLHLFELLNPCHRLIDFWCGHPQAEPSTSSVSTWTETEWRRAEGCLHPQLHHSKVKNYLLNCVQQRQAFDVTLHLSAPVQQAILIPDTLAASLLPLWEGPQPVQTLVDRYLALRPVDPLTLIPVSEQQAFQEIVQLLKSLEVYLYILLRLCP